MSRQADPPLSIRWNDLFPWLILVRALRVALLVRVLFIAFLGVMLTEMGWSTLDRMFSDVPIRLQRLTENHIEPMSTSNSPIPSTIDNATAFRDFSDGTNAGPLIRGWTWLTKPFVLLANRATSWRRSWVLMLSGIWAIAVWALLGGAITRIAAMYLTQGETLGPGVALQAAATKWMTTAGAPLIALASAAALALPLVVDGLLMRFDFLAMLAGLFWALILVWGLLLAIVLLGLMLGWPLMWATIGVERTDAFDGVSRCYAYVYQRPLHFVAYVLIASVLGILGEMAVHYVASAGVTLSEWTVSWGAGSERTALLVAGTSQNMAGDLSGMAGTAARAVQFWKWVLSAIADSFAVAYLWPASTGIYLLLRRHVDSAEMEDVALDQEDPTQGLPGLTTDETGIPQVDKTEEQSSNDGE